MKEENKLRTTTITTYLTSIHIFYLIYCNSNSNRIFSLIKDLMFFWGGFHFTFIMIIFFRKKHRKYLLFFSCSVEIYRIFCIFTTTKNFSFLQDFLVGAQKNASKLIYW